MGGVGDNTNHFLDKFLRKMILYLVKLEAPLRLETKLVTAASGAVVAPSTGQFLPCTCCRHVVTKIESWSMKEKQPNKSSEKQPFKLRKFENAAST